MTAFIGQPKVYRGGSGVSVGDTIGRGGVSPEVQAELDKLEEIQAQLNPIFQEALDPEVFEQRQERFVAQRAAAVRNQIANLGLGGSALESGAVAEAETGAGLALTQQRLREVQGLGQIQAGLTQARMQGLLTSEAMQQQAEQSLMEYEAAIAQAEAAEAAGKAGGIGTAIGTIGGFALGGPIGGILGGGAGGAVGAGTIGVGAGGTATAGRALAIPAQGAFVGSGFTPGVGLSNVGFTGGATGSF